MARQCHANTCPVGIATQRDDLRAGFAGTPEMLVGYLRLIAQEVREILARVGAARLQDLIGRADLLRIRDGAPIDLTGLIDVSDHRSDTCQTGLTRVRPRTASESSDWPARPAPPAPPVLPAPPALPARVITNTDRAFGAAIAGAIAERFGDAGLPDGSVQLTLEGSAGQSFGAFALPGMRLVLTGDANDGVGKGMHGGEIVVAPKARERGRTGQTLVGNAALYGATGGRLFVGGAAGERFAVRNSGATAVVEGVGNHGCEYMTGGTVLVLGPIGRNFAAGFTGGTVFVLGGRDAVAARIDQSDVAVQALTPTDHAVVRDLLEAHVRLTGSRVARSLLRNDPTFSSFSRVTPILHASRFEVQAVDAVANASAI
jgi:glutamate synthase domain-containing protein 3